MLNNEPNSKRVTSLLLVDDDTDDHEVFKMALQETERAVLFAGVTGGEQALKTLDNTATKPDVIFLDVNMPMLNGFETLQQIKRKDDLRDIPIVMYSTSSSSQDECKAIRLGAMAYLSKPSTLTELSAFLKTFLMQFRVTG